MKYIIFQEEVFGRKIPFIFPNELVHEDVNMAIHSLGMYRIFKPINAGEISVIEVEVYGKSVTLNLVSDASDKLVIETLDYLHGL